MLHLIRRHPLAVEAYFRHVLVVTYAFPADVLRPLLPAGLVLDTYRDYGFLAVALVQTESLRPVGLPKCLGRSFFLSGYRLFAKHQLASHRTLRGLRILRSDTNRRIMVAAGNLLTHYQYRLAKVHLEEAGDQLDISVRTEHAQADLDLTAVISAQPAALPPESPFASMQLARRFAGPLPFTFDYEPESHSIIMIEGRRSNWNPQPIDVRIERCTFTDSPIFRGVRPLLANAFYVHDVPYRWERGVLSHLAERN